jgi:hypothetical protein
MPNAYLFTLPVELIYSIFDHLDVQTIVRSVRLVSRQFYALANTYDRLELNFVSIPKSSLRFISRIIRFENVTSLIVSFNEQTSSKIDCFYTYFGLSRFTRLRSLSFIEMDPGDIEPFLHHITTCNMVSLSIKFHRNPYESSRAMTLLSSVIAQSSLRKLHLHSFDYIIHNITISVQWALNHLTIDTCTYGHYCTVLGCCPQLQTIIMTDCTEIDKTILLSSANRYFPQRISLTLRDCRLSTEDLESLLSLTPSLVHFKMVSTRSVFDSVFDATFWEKFVQTKLLCFNRFEFFFTYSVEENTIMPSLESIISPFRAPFWLNDKHWFVTCDYILNSSQLILYTTLVPTDDFEILIKYEALSTNNAHLLARRWINDTTDLTTNEVGVNISLTKVDRHSCCYRHFYQS